MGTLLVRQVFQGAFGLGLRRQDTFHRSVGAGPVTQGALQGGQDIDTAVTRQERQQTLGLVLAVTFATQQDFQEPRAYFTQFAEALLQLGQTLPRVLGGWPMRFAGAALAGHLAREQLMACALDHTRIIDDDVRVGDAHRQGAADVLPGDRITIVAIENVAFDTDDAVTHRIDLIVLSRQGDQMGLFLFVKFAWRLFRLAMHAQVGDVGQPVRRHLVEMGQRAEGTAVKQILLDVKKRSLDFALRLRPVRPARLGPITIVRGEGQETRVVQRYVVLVALHNNLKVVVQASGRHATQVREGAHVLAQGGVEVLSLDEAEVLPPRVGQQVTEDMDAATAFLGEVDVMGGIIHLGLHAGARLKADNGTRSLAWPLLTQPEPHRRVTPREAVMLEFLEQTHGGQVGVAAQQFQHDGRVGIEATGTTCRHRFVAGTLVLHAKNDTPYRT